MQVNSSFELHCRQAVLNTLNSGIPVRKLQHKYNGEPIKIIYGFDTKTNRDSNGRCDIVLWIEYEHRKETICIECKSGMRDLKSGYGLNFDGDINYILYPKNASRFIQDGYWGLNKDKIEKVFWQNGIRGVGILELDDQDKIRFVKRPYRKIGTFDFMGLATEFGDY